MRAFVCELELELTECETLNVIMLFSNMHKSFHFSFFEYIFLGAT